MATFDCASSSRHPESLRLISSVYFKDTPKPLLEYMNGKPFSVRQGEDVPLEALKDTPVVKVDHTSKFPSQEFIIYVSRDEHGKLILIVQLIPGNVTSVANKYEEYKIAYRCVVELGIVPLGMSPFGATPKTDTAAFYLVKLTSDREERTGKEIWEIAYISGSAHRRKTEETDALMCLWGLYPVNGDAKAWEEKRYPMWCRLLPNQREFLTIEGEPISSAPINPSAAVPAAAAAVVLSAGAGAREDDNPEETSTRFGKTRGEVIKHGIRQNEARGEAIKPRQIPISASASTTASSPASSSPAAAAVAKTRQTRPIPPIPSAAAAKSTPSRPSRNNRKWQ